MTFHQSHVILDPVQKTYIERLESRQLLSGGPQLINVQLLGGAKACTGVVLTFNESLDVARASDVRAYSIGRVRGPSRGSSSDFLSNFFPFAGRPKSRTIKNGKVQFVQANYNDLTHSVTLLTALPFAAWKYFRAVRIRGTGDFALTDTAGNAFDGNNDGTGGDDTVLTWVYHKGKRIHYRDQDGDIVTLKLKGKGELFSIQHPIGPRLPMLFIEGAVPGSTIVSGAVVQKKTGDGIADIAQLTGFASADVTLLTDQHFRIGTQFP